MATFTIHQAKSNLSQLIARAKRGEEVVIARGNQPVARLVALAPVKPVPKFGGWEGKLKMAHDFDTELADFGEYMAPLISDQ